MTPPRFPQIVVHLEGTDQNIGPLCARAVDAMRAAYWVANTVPPTEFDLTGMLLQVIEADSYAAQLDVLRRWVTLV